MTEIELKSLLHERIESINDLDFLEVVNKLLEDKHPEISDVKLPAHIIDILKAAKLEVAEGKYKTNDEVENATNQWLNE
jgi:hypothetical protein